MKRRLAVSFLTAFLSFAVVPFVQAADAAPTRATLPNGMRVVIIQNTLAPVVTVEANFMVGGDETPDGFPGMAHAQEHMAFRGCKGMTADQTAAIFALMGGDNNADTQQNITQYFETVPSADVDVALEAQAACMRGIDDSQAEWDQERGAIEQEVSRDLSNPTYKFVARLNQDLFAGTPYAHDALGTRPSFDKTTGAMLKEFDGKWYSPSNMILVIVGDIDPAATLGKIRRAVRRYSKPCAAAAFGDQSAAGEAGDLHARQQSALRSWIHRVAHAGNRLARLCGSADSWRRAGQPAGGHLRDGSGRQGAGGGIRSGGDVSQSQRWVRRGGAARGAGRDASPRGDCGRS